MAAVNASALCVPEMPAGPPFLGLETAVMCGTGEECRIEAVAFLLFALVTLLLMLCAARPEFAAVLLPGAALPSARSTFLAGALLNLLGAALFGAATALTGHSKLVALLGSVHNLGEWMMLGNVYLALLGSLPDCGGGLRNALSAWNRFFGAEVAIVATVGWLLPDLRTANFPFYVFGGWCDAQLVVASTITLWALRDVPGARWPMGLLTAACLLHLLSFLLLVSRSFGRLGASRAAILSVLTAMLSSLCLTLCSLEFDVWQAGLALEAGHDAAGLLPSAGKASADEDAPFVPRGVRSVLLRGWKLWAFMAVSLAVSAACVLWRVLAFGYCAA